jgi:penicillin-binding protein 2
MIDSMIGYTMGSYEIREQNGLLKNSFRFSCWFCLALLLLVGCGGGDAPRPDAAQPTETAAIAPVGPATAAPTIPPTLSPTPELPPPTAAPVEAVALAFFRGWEEGDYLRMYAALAPESQAAIDSRSFVARYEQAMRTAAVQSVEARLLAVDQEGDRAELQVRVRWQTAAFGDISRDNQVILVRDERGRWGLLWQEGLILPELQAGWRLEATYQTAERAPIYDIHGRPLAYQGSVVTLGVIPERIADETGMLNALSLVLDQTPEQVKAIYAPARPDWYWPIADITGEVWQAHRERLEPHLDAGLTASERAARLYPQGEWAAHLVGYTGFIPAERLAEYQAAGYQGDEQVGLTGLEAWGEPYLRGVSGSLFAVGPAGERLPITESGAGTAGAIYATIDLDFQRAAAEALAAAVTSHPESGAGAIVALEVATGRILAMASYPAYDPVVFDGRRLDAAGALGEALRHPGRPLLNRAAQGEYPPGSTFKIVTLAAALNSGLYTPASTYASTGEWNRLGPNFIQYDWLEGGHGVLTMVEALAASCNSCFYDAAFTLNEADPDLLPLTARQFGLGASTGVEGMAEASGLIPDPDYKAAVQGLAWEAGDAVNMGIGQGFVLATPLQLAALTAAIANGGELMRPTLIDRIGEGESLVWPTTSAGRLPLAPEHLAAIQEGMWGVANSELGTAFERLRRLAVPVAGKTGTSEAGGRPHAFFVGYAPAAPYTAPDGRVIAAPEIAIVVLLEHSGEGSEVAAPVFRRLVELYYGLRPLTPYPVWQ